MGAEDTFKALQVWEDWEQRGLEQKLHWIQDSDLPNKKYLAWYVPGHPEEGEVVYLT